VNPKNKSKTPPAPTVPQTSPEVHRAQAGDVDPSAAAALEACAVANAVRLEESRRMRANGLEGVR
jgi:hypothetical protein